MEKKDIRSDLLKSFGMESRAFTWLEEIKRNVSSGARAWKSHLCLAVRQH